MLTAYASTTNIIQLPVATSTEAVQAFASSSFEGTPLWNIAKCESNLEQYDASGTPLLGKINPRDIGILQINQDAHGKEAEEMGLDLSTTEGNVEFGLYLYFKYGTEPWDYSRNCWDKLSTRLP